jgi:hypothetical protein
VTPPGAPGAASVIDRWMPVFDVATRHAIEIAASRETVYRILRTTDPSRHWLVALLMGLRRLPAQLAGPVRAAPRPGADRGSLRGPTGFCLLEEAPPGEFVLGLTGRFWTASGGLVPTDAEHFRDGPPAGFARAVWGFALEDLGPRTTRLVTETRVRCAEAASRRRFLLYWRVIRPGSGLIRRALLRRVRRDAELAGN